VLALTHGVSPQHAAEPAYMYHVAFGYVLPWPNAVLLLTAAFVVVSQLKINVMNAYAGSLAWSNFFSRLTHSHPGRVVWLLFNVAIALLLMELGIYKALEQTLGLFAIVAVAWLGAIVADLSVNKPLGLSPPGIEFKRAHLYDINPVGVGAMGIATVAALAAYIGAAGEIAQALAPFISLGTAFVAAPAIAWATGGRTYLARKPRAHWLQKSTLECRICEHAFEPEDMAYCPAYAAPICSLCCSLDARCHDLCKPKARLESQLLGVVKAMLPAPIAARFSIRIAQYAGLLTLFTAVIGIVLLLIHFQTTSFAAASTSVIEQALWAAFFILFILAGIVAWFLVLAQESRHVAQEESARQTTLLLKEIDAHRRTDAALQRAKEAAEAANLAKSRYVVGLSHELRTPLNAVLGYAQILERDGAVPPERRNGVRVIRRSAEHLSGLIDGLLDISKIEAGRLQLYRNEIRIADFLDQLVEMVRPQAEAKGLAFAFEKRDPLPEVVATDEKRLRQILINLLSNAIKFTAAGTVGVAVAYRNQVASLSVTDTGPGVPAQDLKRIFEPFERGTDLAARALPGLGLGLTITKLLAELMGGEVTVASEPGRGSTFTVRLMLSAVAHPVAVRPARSVRGYAGPRRTVLVVDDDADHRALMRELLEPIGFTVLAAPDGPSALMLAAELQPDLFLLDIAMPGMDGWALAAALRAGHREAAIVMLSANIGELHPPGGERAFHDDTLGKPFDLAQLLDRLQALLKLEWIDADGAAPSPAAPVPFDAAEPLAGPGADHVAELLRLGRIGYVRGIEKKLAELDADPDNRPFVAAIRGHLGRFDFRRLTATLESIGTDE
jgi:signal transduction histidine kinase